jgi:hypothetical protein
MGARRSPRKARPSDRAASAVILCCLGVIGLAVYLTGRSDDSRTSTGLDPRWVAGEPILPDEIDSLGLSVLRTFGPEDLYEYINGQAPHYIQFGFRAVLVGEYASDPAALPSVVVDLYDMELRRNAYGLFMESFPPEEEMIDLGNAGFVSGSVAVFWKGPFYVRVMGLGGADPEARVERAAALVADRIEDESAELVEFSLFPRDDLLADTLSFIKTAAFGLAHLRETFVATYDSDEGPYRLFFCELEGAEATLELLEAHAEFLRSREGLDIARIGGEESLVSGEDRYIGPTLLLAKGRFVAGSARLADREAARMRVDELLERVIRGLDAEGEDDTDGTS